MAAPHRKTPNRIRELRERVHALVQERIGPDKCEADLDERCPGFNATQTRRILKPQPQPFKLGDGRECDVYLMQCEHDPLPRVALGNVLTKQEVRFAVGDRLWVRENWRPATWDSDCSFWIEYPADGTRSKAVNGDGAEELCERLCAELDRRGVPVDGAGNYAEGPKCKPSIHMPRWASRLTLLVTAVKIERVQDISEEDAKAEGMVFVDHGLNRYGQQCEGWHSDKAEAERGPDFCLGTARFAFGNLWEKLHGPDAWAQNPFVVAITFRVIKANIDAPEAREAA